MRDPNLVRNFIDLSVKNFNEGNHQEGVVNFRLAIGAARRLSTITNIDRLENFETQNDKESRKFRMNFLENFPQSEIEFDKKQISIVSDSIGLNRDIIDLHMEGTYSYKIQEKILNDGHHHRVVPFCRRNRTSDDALNFIKSEEFLSEGKTDILILQIGIVDCAPRVFSMHDIQCVIALCGMEEAKKLIHLASRFRAHLMRPWRRSAYVGPKEFLSNITEIIRYAYYKLGIQKIYFLNIVKPSRKGKVLSTGELSKAIDHYNKIISQMDKYKSVSVIDMNQEIWRNDQIISFFTNDNYHYNSLGHEAASQIIYKHIKSYLENEK